MEGINTLGIEIHLKNAESLEQCEIFVYFVFH